jgi:hypothetical protein
MSAMAQSRPARQTPSDIGAARELLYGSFQIWLWSRGFGTMEEIESELRSGGLEQHFRNWLRVRSSR